MKNKSFSFYKNASLYFNTVSHSYVAFFIHNKEDECYEVIDQDTYDHYAFQHNLDMELIDFTC